MFLMCNLFSLAFLTKWISKPRASHLLDALFKSKGKHLTKQNRSLLNAKMKNIKTIEKVELFDIESIQI